MTRGTTLWRSFAWVLLGTVGYCGVAHAAVPNAPSNLVATAVSSTQISLSWTDLSNNETSFKIERKTGSGSFAQIATVGSSVTSFNSTGLSAGTTYSYRVRASNSSGNSAYTSVASATTSSGPDTTPPAAPTGLVTTAVSTSQINLNWTASTDNVGVTGYRVERCAGGDPFSCNVAGYVQIAAPTSASFNDTGLTPATTYYYRLRAADAAGNLSAYSGPQPGRTLDPPDTTPPTVPTGVVATVWNASTIKIDWTASTDNVQVTEYRIERCTGANCTAFVQVFTFWGVGQTDTGLAAATTYRYRLRAADAAGNLSGYSSIVTATTFNSPDTTPPTAPTGLIAVPASATRIDLTWGPSTDEIFPGTVAGYRVERCQGAACANFLEVAAPQVLFFFNTGLAPATTYRYRVRAADSAGNLSAYSGTVSAATPNASSDTTPPSTPSISGFVATAVSTTQINLIWTASTDNVGVTGYRVERGEGCYDPLRWSCNTTLLVGTPSGTSFSDVGLTPATLYKYRLRAADAVGNLSEYSMWIVAQTLSDTTAPSPPTGLTATATSASQINLSWTASTDSVGVTGYRVERCQGAGCSSFVQVGTPTATNFNDAGLATGTSYSYRVRATDAAANLSAYSNVASATLSGASLTVTSPSPGAVISGDTVMVTGTFVGPTNSGITVNGVVAGIVGTTFVAANVPLQLGDNTLTATLTTPSTGTATQTFSVTSTGPASMEVIASPAQGVAPVSVTFTIDNRTGRTIQSVQADYLGTGSFTTVNLAALTNNYTASGLYQAAFVIIDSTGASYQRTVPIAVQDVAQINQMLQTAWGEFSTALAAGDTSRALTYFNVQAQQKFQPVFQILGADLPQIVASFSPLQAVSVTSEIGEYAINRTIGGVNWIFFIYFMRDTDGVWKIDDM